MRRIPTLMVIDEEINKMMPNLTKSLSCQRMILSVLPGHIIRKIFFFKW